MAIQLYGIKSAHYEFLKSLAEKRENPFSTWRSFRRETVTAFFDKKSETKSCYYIPVVEKLANKAPQKRWQYAQDPHAYRLFFTSVADLYAQMGRTLIHCYKVELTDLQLATLPSAKIIGDAYLLPFAFAPKEIMSLIEKTALQQQETANPDYKEASLTETSVSASSPSR